MLLKGFHKAPAGVFVDCRILIELLSFCLINETDGGDELHIDLDPLPRILHLLIRLRNVFGIWRLYRYEPLFSEEAVKSRKGTLISPLAKLNPKNNETGMGIPAPHVLN